MRESTSNTIAISVLIIIVCTVLVGSCATWPRYRVWQREMSGKAALREAEWDRQILVEEAKANFQAEQHNAQAEIARAVGVAAADSIVAEGLRGETEYLQYLAIRAQEKMANSPNHTTVYIPSGPLGMPLLTHEVPK